MNIILSLLTRNPLVSILGFMLVVSLSLNLFQKSVISDKNTEITKYISNQAKSEEAIKYQKANEQNLVNAIDYQNKMIEKQKYDQAVAEKQHSALVAKLKHQFEKEKAEIFSSKPVVSFDCNKTEDVSRAKDALGAVQILFGDDK